MTTGAVVSRNGRTIDESQSGGWWPHEASAAAADEAVEEVTGEVSGISQSAQAQQAHAEASTDAAESGEEFTEAAPEALAEAEGAESATSDLRAEGYEPPEAAGQESAGAQAQGVIPEAGTALHGGQEFLPLAGLAANVVPLLASAAGPNLARAVQGRLSPRSRRVLTQPRAGGGLIAVLQQLLAQAMKRQEAAEEAVDEALVEEVAQSMEVIIGTDDRIRIQNTTKVPWRRYCALRIEFANGRVYRGTGFFIGERTIATAGHCVYSHSEGGWARRIEVIPACDGTQRPFGSAFATSFRSTVGWTQDKKPEADYGAIILPANAFPGQKFGHFGFRVFTPQELLAQPAVLAGYPGDKPFAELWGMRRKIKAVTAQTLIYDIDTMGGQSGAPVYLKKDGKRYVVGVHNYGAAAGNSATRVTAAVVANFKRWSLLAGAAPQSAPAAKAPQAQMAAATAGSELDV